MHWIIQKGTGDECNAEDSRRCKQKRWYETGAMEILDGRVVVLFLRYLRTLSHALLIRQHLSFAEKR
jgi:hypothetical protein